MSLQRPLRVLVADTEEKYSVGGSFARGFRALGHEAVFFDQKRWLGSWMEKNRVVRLARTAARPAALAALNFALLTEVLARRPDLVLVMKGDSILPETIDAMRRGARVIVSYHTDDFENPLNTNQSMLRSIPLWDVLFSPRDFIGAELAARGVRRYEPLPFGYDPLLSHPAPHAPLPDARIRDSVVFVGTWAPERVGLLEGLVGRVPVSIWGNGWERVPRTSSLLPSLALRQVIDEPLCAILSQAGVSLCLLRKGNRDRHTMRTFELPACGGFMLAERTTEHLAWFEEGREAAFFEGQEELEAQAARYLADPAARRRMAEAGHRRVMAGHHSYQDRASRIVEVVSELL